MKASLPLTCFKETCFIPIIKNVWGKKRSVLYRVNDLEFAF